MSNRALPRGQSSVVTSTVRQRDGAIVRAERARSNQSLVFEMSSAPTRTIGIVAQVVQIGLGHNPKGADGSQHAALGAVDLVDTVALPNGPALTATRQVQVLREHVARVAIGRMIAFAALPRPPRLRSTTSRSWSFDERGSYLSHIRLHVAERHHGGHARGGVLEYVKVGSEPQLTFVSCPIGEGGIGCCVQTKNGRRCCIVATRGLG